MVNARQETSTMAMNAAFGRPGESDENRKERFERYVCLRRRRGASERRERERAKERGS